MKTDETKYQNLKITSDSLKNLKETSIYFFLKHNNFSETYINKLRKESEFLILNGKPATLKTKIRNGDILQVATNPTTNTTQILAIDIPLDIIFEDNDYLIVNKPHNLACMPSQSHYFDNLGGRIVSYMKKSNNFILRIINRLDKDTAGIVVIAKNLLAYKNFKFASKEYFALCEGHFDKTKTTINKPILTINNNGINEMKRIVSTDGKTAITHIETIQKFSKHSLIKAILETGRTHQIRVHTSSENHALLYDPIYNPKYKEVPFNNNSHTFLILKKISFIHFQNNKEITLEVPFPDDWIPFLEQ
ncbi:MAG: RluA family pseudouridine synthase [Clostridia bacterium]|nr:RluA family pseudouridine synthase [Clostridia bacterium]